MNKTFFIQRLKAFAIDYAIILIYIGVLAGVTLLLSSVFDLKFGSINPATGQLIGFTTLTLPVILYFTILEKSKYAGTIGKRKTGLQVVSISSTKATAGQLLLRNCVKFLPWEIAHFFIYKLFYFSTRDQSIPEWLLLGLIAAQLIAIIYVLFILFTKSNRSIYEIISRTKVIRLKKNTLK